MHSITGRLNRDANTHNHSNGGVTFFVSLGEKNYDYKNKKDVWSNYEAAIWAKESQVDYLASMLVKGSIIAVSGDGIIPKDEGEHGIKLIMQNAQFNVGFNPNREQATHNQGMAQANQVVNHQAANQPGNMDSFEGEIPF